METSNITDRLTELEQSSRILELDSSEFSKLAKESVQEANHFVSEILPQEAFFGSYEINDAVFRFSDQGTAWSIIIQELKDNVSRNGILCASEGHLGYIPGGGLRTGALADLLAAVYNVYAGMHFASPGAVRLENAMIAWLCNLIGYPDTAYGNLSSGGSIANLMAVCTARDQGAWLPKDYDRLVIYLSAQTHHCVHKALRVAGLGHAIIREVPLDDRFRIRAAALDQSVKADRAQGLIPFMVVASAGTTDTGAIDPLDEIADICEAEGLWFHVDAAYGGGFILVDEYRELFAGIERSDSCVIDPHKGFFLSYGIGALLIKDRQALHNSHFYKANYMQDSLHEMEPSPADFSPELTKHFRGLRMWMSMKYFGLNVFKDALREKKLLCQYFYHEIGQYGFEIGPSPELSVCIYRYQAAERTEEFNAALIKRLHEDGRVFISSTTINGDTWLRMAILSFRTHRSTIDRAIEMLREHSETLQREWLQ